MTTTIDPPLSTAPASAPAPTAARRRQPWALWGAAAGILGFAGIMADGSFSLAEADYLKGAALIDQLDHRQYHYGIVLGLAAAFALLVAAAGWKRLGEALGDSLAARFVPMAMTASAGAMFLGYGFKGSLAIYLQGGMDAGSHPKEGLYSVFMFLDFAPFIAWWGVAFAALGIVWLAFKDRAVPRWIGAISVLFGLFPLAIVGATALPGVPAISTPLWLVITSIGLAASRAVTGRPAPAP